MSALSKTHNLVDAAWVAAHLQDPNIRLVEVDVIRWAEWGTLPDTPVTR